MSNALECPVSHGRQRDGLASFRFETAQELIRHPEDTTEILGNASDTVAEYYYPITKANPRKGRYKAFRALRGITVSAGTFNGATVYMNRVGPDLAELPVLTDVSDSPALSRRTDLLSASDSDAQNSRSQRFVNELGGVMQEWMRSGLLEPEPETQLLADAARALHIKFAESEKRHNPATPRTSDFDKFCRLASEENAATFLEAVVGFAGSKQLETGEPIDPLALAAEIIGEGQSINDLASVNRGFGNSTTFPMDPATFESPMLQAYEMALKTDGTLEPDVIAPRFMMHAGHMRPAYPVLRNGPWREPGMCAGFPSFEARTKELTQGNQLFFRAVGRLLGNNERAETEQRKWSAVEAALNVGALAALNTVFVDFPLVGS